jgi:CHAT domain-containing protein
MLRMPFDVAAAHALYRQILGPADALLAGATQLIVISDGALQSLPLGVLVTELPAKPITATADHAQVAWLAKKYAITFLPAASSLRALRQFAKTPASREPFAGFGDPVLGGSGEGTRRLNVAALYSRGAIADVNEVRKLPRLPDR